LIRLPNAWNRGNIRFGLKYST